MVMRMRQDEALGIDIMTGAAVQAASFSHAQLKVSQLWPLERYARLTQEKQQFLLHTQLQPPNVQNTGGSWKVYIYS